VNINFITDIFDGCGDEFKRTDLPPGSAAWAYQGDEIQSLLFICPCGGARIRSVPVRGDRKWDWNGNETLPTLTPSILIVGECRWHGYLTNGEWRTV